MDNPITYDELKQRIKYRDKQKDYKKEFNEAELSIIIHMFMLHGPDWEVISQELKNKTPKQVEEVFYEEFAEYFI